MKNLLFTILALISISGCAVRVVDVKTMTIQPQKTPVTIIVKGTATCKDYVFFYYVTEQLDVKSSDGQRAESIQ